VGAFGLLGNIGSTGSVGSVGASGSNGTTGGTGPTGNTGSTGSTGGVGSIGAVGLAGGSGLLGNTGPTGNVGPTGAFGSTGHTGATGSIGGTGTTGPGGVSGLLGNVGLIGGTGSTGSAGAGGSVGNTGNVGNIGNVGAVGSPGPAGPSATPTVFGLSFGQIHSGGFLIAGETAGMTQTWGETTELAAYTSYENGGGFDAGAGTYTVQASGYYNVFIVSQWNTRGVANSNADGTVDASLVNSTTGSIMDFQVNVGVGNAGSVNLSVNQNLYLTAGEILNINVTNNTSTFLFEDFTIWSLTRFA
jgi:hypothetical protein